MNSNGEMNFGTRGSEGAFGVVLPPSILDDAPPIKNLEYRNYRGIDRMRFAFLAYPEVEGVAICWDENLPKTSELVAAALAAGFSEWEVRESPVGVLEREFVVSDDWAFRTGARVLIGMNGSTLIELL